MENLVRVKIDPALAFAKVDEPVEHQLDQSKEKTYQPAARLVAWAVERPLDLCHMMVSCAARVLPRLALSEAKRLLCTALPRLFEQRHVGECAQRHLDSMFG